MESPLDTAFASLDAYQSRIPSDVLQAWINECSIQFEDVRNFCRFHPQHYVRNLICSGQSYHGLVLCWRNGHRSPIHDHRGSACAVRVLSGEALETTFEVADNGMIYAAASRTLATGTSCFTQDADIHQVSNLQGGGADLVTLHVYSPPLMRMNVYSLHGADVREFFDPVNDEFVAGAGI